MIILGRDIPGRKKKKDTCEEGKLLVYLGNIKLRELKLSWKGGEWL